MCKEPPASGNALCSASSGVAEMFDHIVPTYDLLNHLLSLGQDHFWRRRAAEMLDRKAELRVADLATGTGDLLIALLRRRPGMARAAGVDISERMLARCREKLRKHGLDDRIDLWRADASTTPFPDGTFDVVTMAFGIRNTSDAGTTLKEIRRILRPGGIALILEFSLPTNRILKWCHLKYLRFAVPFLGALVSGDHRAYRYLDESIERFCRSEDLTGLMGRTGFREVSVVPLTFGVASIYRGMK